MISVIFYLLIFGIEAFFSNKLYHIYFFLSDNKDRKRMILIILLAALPSILVSSLRVNIGTDYTNYISMYHYVRVRTFLDRNVNNVELGFRFLIKLLSFFSINTRPFFVITSLTYGYLMKYATFKIAKLDEIRNVGLLSFLMNVFLYPFSLNGIRQAIAIALVFNSIFYVRKENWKKFMLCIFGASFFHTTAIFFVIIYFINKSFMTKKTLILTVIFFSAGLTIVKDHQIILNLFKGNQILSKYLLDYLNKKENINIVNIIIFNSPILIGLFFYNSNVLIKSNILYLNITILGIFLLLCSPSYAYFFRLTYYCYPMQILLVPMVVSKFRQQILIKILYVTYGIIYFVHGVYISGLNNIIPYQCILGGF